MSVLLDTGIVYAYYDRSDRWHDRARGVMQAEEGGLVLPAPVIPEVDHLLGVRLGPKSRQAFYAGIVGGSYVVVDLPMNGYDRVAALNRQFDDLDLGFVDAAVAVLAESMALTRIATTDRRHFEPLAALMKFELVP